MVEYNSLQYLPTEEDLPEMAIGLKSSIRNWLIENSFRYSFLAVKFGVN
jgi:hypothetical protein